eukprot:2668745-Alexandrium_andersonii.AAC.1
METADSTELEAIQLGRRWALTSGIIGLTATRSGLNSGSAAWTAALGLGRLDSSTRTTAH